MAQNEIFRNATHLSLPVGSTVKAGDPVKVGVLNGVAQTAPGEGGNPPGYATVWLQGAFKVPVTGTVAKVGDPIYIEDGELNVTGTHLFGAAYSTNVENGPAGVIIIQTGETAA